MSRREAVSNRVCVGLYEVWRGPRARDQQFEYRVDETASTRTESQSKSLTSSAKEQKENHRQNRQRVRRPTVAEDGDEAHQREKAGRRERLPVEGARHFQVPTEIRIKVSEDGKNGEACERDRVDCLRAPEATKGFEARNCDRVQGSGLVCF